MIKKSRWLTYVRGFSLLLALALLFLGLLPGEGPPPVYGPALQARSGEGTSPSFQFAVLSDLHKGWGVFKPIIKELARDGYDLTIIEGDIVAEGNEDRYRFFFRELSKVKGKTPIYFVPGNHDVSGDNGTYSVEKFRRYCGPDYYWFSWGKATFVVLNDAQSTISEDQLRWLETTLRKLRGISTHIFVFMHVPPFDPRADNSYCLPERIGKRFMQLIEKFGVDYVFSGHLHCYFREVINGVTYIGCPSAGGTPRCPNPSYGYIHVAVSRQGLKDSVVKVENNWRLQLKGAIQYELRVRSPILLPLTVVMGQPLLYLLAF